MPTLHLVLHQTLQASKESTGDHLHLPEGGNETSAIKRLENNSFHRVHMKGNVSLGWSGANAGFGEAASWWNGNRALLPVS